MAFARMAELGRSGIKPTPAGVRPLDDIMKSMRADSSVMLYMLPVLATPAPKRTWDDAFAKGSEGWGKEGKGKDKGKDKSKGKWMSTAWNAGKPPEALRRAGGVGARQPR